MESTTNSSLSLSSTKLPRHHQITRQNQKAHRYRTTSHHTSCTMQSITNHQQTNAAHRTILVLVPTSSNPIHHLNATTTITMNTLTLILTILLLFTGTANGFTSPTTQSSNQYRYRNNFSALYAVEEGHPAVIGWPAKYVECGGSNEGTTTGPEILSTEFQIQKASTSQLEELDVTNWPTWTTSDKPKWAVGNQVIDKEMPYGELSYVLSGKLEIIPQSTGVPEIVNVGDFVTFPKGFVASWKVLEELTWHYYLY